MFGNLFGKRDFPRALGIDIGSSAIKIVELRRQNGQAILETYGELSLGPYAGLTVGQSVQLPADKIASALSDLLKEKEVAVKTNRCGIAIPFTSSLISVVEMPSVGPKELQTMVPIEARKYIPVPIQEVMLDWSVIPRPAPHPAIQEEVKFPKIDVLIAAIHNDTIARFQEIVAKAALEASFFEIEIFSTMRSILDEGLRPVLIMDMGAASTKIYIIERGLIRASHTVNRGSQEITSAISKSLGVSPEEAEVMKRKDGLLGADNRVKEVASLVLDHIFAEADSTLLAFEKRHNKTVAKVMLVGGGAALKGLIDLAKNNFKTEVFLGEPFDKVSTPAFLEKILSETGPEFAVSIGVALRKLSEEG